MLERARAIMMGSRLRRNGAVAALQAVVAMVAVFATYRLVIGQVGIEVFGIWAVLLAGASVARMADVSGSGGLARFVGELLNTGRAGEAVTYVHTTLVATLGLMVASCSVVMVLAPWLFRFFLPDAEPQMLALLPLVLVACVVLPALSAALCAALDGTLRVDVRAGLMSVSYVVQFVTVWLLVARFGIVGFVMALGAQHVFLVMTVWLALRRQMPGLGWLPARVSREAFRAIFGFGLQVQATSLAGLFSDPLARLMIAHAGGPAAVGVYELALRMVQQLRGFFVAALQPLLPHVAALADHAEERDKVVLQAVRVSAGASLLFTLAALIAAPLYAHLMMGAPTAELLIFTAVLAAGYGANLLSVPLFFAAMAQGMMRWNLCAQILVACCIAGGGALLAPGLGATGVVLAQTIGLVAGALVIGIGNAFTLALADRLQGELLMIGTVLALTAAGAGASLLMVTR